MSLLRLVRLAWVASATFAAGVGVVSAANILQRPDQLGSAHAASTPSSVSSQLTHPDTLVLDLRRSDGASLKARIKAAQGNPYYQRLLAAQRHGAQLNAESHALHLMGATPTPAPLTGCPFADFLIPIDIGAETFGPY